MESLPPTPEHKRHRPGTASGVRASGLCLRLVLCLPWAPGCASEPLPAAPLTIARHVEQLLDDPSSLPVAGQPETSTPAAAPALAAEATPAVVAAQPPQPAQAEGALGEPQPQPAPSATAPDAKDEAQEPPAAEQGARVKKGEKSAKADRKDRALRAEKVEAAEKPEKPDSGDDIRIPEGADATDLYYSGKRRLDGGDLSGAIADLRASNKLRYSVRTLTLLGRAYFDAGQMSLAEKSLRGAGTYEEAMLLLAQMYQQMGKHSQARKVYQKFLDIHADHPKAEWVRKILQAI